MARPIDIVRKVCPRARASYLTAFGQGDALFVKHGINTPLRLAHFLAQCLHETNGLSLERESGSYSAARLMQIFGVGNHSAAITETEARRLAMKPQAIFERVYGVGNPKKSRELGNLKPGDGYRYRGGGIMQTTGRANYRRMGQRCGVDFEANPELVLSAEHALKPALAEWTDGKLNAAADRNDIRAITKRINGGYNGLADRQAWFAKVRPLIDSVDLDIKAERPAQPTIPPPPDIEPPDDPPPVHVPIWKRFWTWVTGTGVAGAGAVGFMDWRALLVLLGFVLVAVTLIVLFMGPDRVRSWIRRQVNP